MTRRDRIVAIIQKISKQKERPEPDESLFDSGLLDSFAPPEVASELEREFSIRIPDRDLHPRKFESVARIEEYIEGRAA